MHTKISLENPYGYNRYGFAWECVQANQTAHLDFGCHHGKFLYTLRTKNIERLIGLDISKDAIKAGKRLYPELEIKHINQTTPLPFADETFNSITILDVLEHVAPQTELLVELNRVLKKNGKLIITVPGRHVFSFLDLGNLKFRFPKLHRWYYCLSHSVEDYEYRYVSNPDGLIGDISVEKAWHEHFRRSDLKVLLQQSGFNVIKFDGSGFFNRLIGNTQRFLKWTGPVNKVLSYMHKLDAKLFESTHLFCLAEKGC